MKRYFASVGLSVVLLFAVLAPAQAQLKNPGVFTRLSEQYFGEVYNTGQSVSLEQSLPRAIGSIISAVLGLVGVILLVIMVYAGFLWLTAGGADEQVAHAKQLIKNGVIGMAITLSAFVITQFVVNLVTGALQQGTGEQQQVQQRPSGAPSNTGTSGSD